MKNCKITFYMTLVLIGVLFFFTFVNIKDTSGYNEKYLINEKEVNYNNNHTVIEGKEIVKLYRTKLNKVEEIPLEEYLIGVVAAEMPASFNIEAIKAQAVAARTYYITKRINNCKNANNAEICDDIHCQAYLSKEECMEKWEDSTKEEYWNKIKMAVDLTKGQVLTYEGKIVEYPQFFSTSSGKTESAVDVFLFDVPYLVSTDSKGEEIAPKYQSSVQYSYSNFIDILKEKHPNISITQDNLKDNIKINSKTQGGAVKEIEIGNEKISGTDFRKLFGLNSTNFEMTFDQYNVNINCKGYGHGVGMSQWGARVMADEGSNYKDILKHYYTGVNIEKVSFSAEN